MIEIIEGLPRNVVGIAVSGRATMQDCRDVLLPAMTKCLKRHDKIRLYYELNSRFPGAAWDDLDLGIEHASRCERVAIVTDVAWVRLTVKALRTIVRMRKQDANGSRARTLPACARGGGCDFSRSRTCWRAG